MEEAELVQQCQRGVNSARKELYERYAGQMLAICLRYTAGMDVSNDLLHDGFLKVLSSFSSFHYKGEGSLKAWMSRIFVNIALEYLKKKDVLKQVVPLEMIAEADEVADDEWEEIPTAVLMQFVRELPVLVEILSVTGVPETSETPVTMDTQVSLPAVRQITRLPDMDVHAEESERLSLYASAGGMMEFCIKSLLSTDYYVDNVRAHRSYTDLNLHKLQYSASASVGAQFEFMKALSLYAEPGISYYFDDKSELETIRKEHPLNIMLLLGLRVSF